jgi:protein tyrosine phosphatase (PTP) superfamily phosphohydrolase (DUF442 family)
VPSTRAGGDLILPAPLPPANGTLPPGGSANPPAAPGPAQFAPPAADYPPSNYPPLGSGPKLGVPQFESPAAKALPPAGVSPPPPPAPRTPETPPMFPSVPAFANVLDRVASGQRPGIEGHESLRRLGYTAVLYLRPPTDDDATDRRLAEKHQLRYLSVPLEENVDSVGRAVEAFARAVDDKSNRPLLVYDAQENRLTGAMWYLYYRTTEKLPDDQARARAGSLGLKQNGNDPLWVAIQSYLSQRG